MKKLDKQFAAWNHTRDDIDWTEECIVEDFENGKHVVDIAKKQGVNTNYVYSVLRRAHLVAPNSEWDVIETLPVSKQPELRLVPPVVKEQEVMQSTIEPNTGSYRAIPVSARETVYKHGRNIVVFDPSQDGRYWHTAHHVCTNFGFSKDKITDCCRRGLLPVRWEKANDENGLEFDRWSIDVSDPSVVKKVFSSYEPIKKTHKGKKAQGVSVKKQKDTSLMMSLKNAADYMNMSDTTLRTLIAAGKIDAHKDPKSTKAQGTWVIDSFKDVKPAKIKKKYKKRASVQEVAAEEVFTTTHDAEEGITRIKWTGSKADAAVKELEELAAQHEATVQTYTERVAKDNSIEDKQNEPVDIRSLEKLEYKDAAHGLLSDLLDKVTSRATIVPQDQIASVFDEPLSQINELLESYTETLSNMKVVLDAVVVLYVVLVSVSATVIAHYTGVW
jgi:hypothetical protein